MKRILVIHGPNLNLLGQREPGIYGYETLAGIGARLEQVAHEGGATLSTFQSNSEGELIDRIHAAADEHVKFIVINPGGLTHTSVSLRDALAAVAIPFIEVHLSNIAARETFRRRSYLSSLAVGVVSGLGAKGYEYAVNYALATLEEEADGLT
jgi:3-dehydroquinate dehydratase-2